MQFLFIKNVGLLAGDKFLKDNELLAQFEAVEEMDSKDKSTIKDIIDAFIKRSKLKNIAAL